MSDVFELFPTPVMRVEKLLSNAQVAALNQVLVPAATMQNHRSPTLTHTAMLLAADRPELAQLHALLAPHVQNFGKLLFGEQLTWHIKEMWVNVMETGGRQAVHNHANCFACGILYLSDVHPSSWTLFTRSLGGRDFVFANTNARAETNAFNADKWRSPQPEPGDLLLFPSYLLHEVPPNEGSRRITLAFNAVPERLDAWGSQLKFQASRGST
jgi:uncharacterized protein (TIGR02466 family)